MLPFRLREPWSVSMPPPGNGPGTSCGCCVPFWSVMFPVSVEGNSGGNGGFLFCHGLLLPDVSRNVVLVITGTGVWVLEAQACACCGLVMGPIAGTVTADSSVVACAQAAFAIA